MKNRTTPRPKSDQPPDIPPATLRKLEEIGRDIAGLRAELAKLTAAQGRDVTRKPRRDTPAR